MNTRQPLPPLGSTELRRFDAKANGVLAVVLGMAAVATRTATFAPAAGIPIGVLLVAVGALLILAPNSATPPLLTVTSAGIAICLAFGLSGVVHGGNTSAGAVEYVLIVLDVSLLRSRREAWLQVTWALGLYGSMLVREVDIRLALGAFLIPTLVLVLLTAAITTGRQRFDELLAELHRQADHDPLTGLLHRDGLERRIRDILANRLGPETARKVGVLALDIDHFKAINDHYGHPAGDEVLIWLSGVLQSNVPPPGLVARVGGEEFLVVFPDVSLAEAFDRAERLRQLIASTSAQQRHPVTVSIGATHGAMPTTEADRPSMTDHYGAADEALYRAKNAGRNRVEVVIPTPLPADVVPQRRAGDVPIALP